MIKVLHIGDNIVINKKDIIGVFNDPAGNSEFLKDAGKNFLLRNDTGENKSFVLTEKNKYFVFFSAISGKILINRMERFEEEVNGKKEKEGKKRVKKEKPGRCRKENA